jgi:hypothetical protein
MSGSKPRQEPLITRLREISYSLRRLAKTDRMVQREAKKGPSKFQQARIESFYEGAIQSGTMAAKLIEEAIRLHPLTGAKGGKR